MRARAFAAMAVWLLACGGSATTTDGTTAATTTGQGGATTGGGTAGAGGDGGEAGHGGGVGGQGGASTSAGGAGGQGGASTSAGGAGGQGGAAPACDDGVKNGDETDVDCGGPTCSVCVNGLACVVGADCLSESCVGGVCAAPTCGDLAKNGAETGVDCGGPDCPGCATGGACASGGDCVSGVCAAGVCADASCLDGVKNGGETAVDCGGSCPTCGDGQPCGEGADCASGVCSGGVCASPSCLDGVKNGGESAPDCGGGSCPGCGDGVACGSGIDCASGVCAGGLCQAPTCVDGLKNGAETGTDCGGPVCGGCTIGSGGVTNGGASDTPAGLQVRVDVATILAQDPTFSLWAIGKELAYCFEQPSGECDATPSAIAWAVLPDAIPPGGSVALTFKDEAATHAKPGASVFDAYDDFDAAALDAAWKKELAGVALDVVDGASGVRLSPSGGAQYGGNELYRLVAAMPSAYVVESRIKDLPNLGYNYPGGLLLVFQDASSWLGLEGQIGSSWTERGEVAGTDSNWLHYYPQNPFKNGWQAHRVDVRPNDTYEVWLDGVKVTAQNAIPASFVSMKRGGIGFAKHGNTGELFADWIRLRKLAEPPPTVVVQ